MAKFRELILEDGSIFKGISFGYNTSVSGEVVFNTGMVGYPESLTDPSYKGQILVLTYPLVGNYGIPKEKIKDKLSQVFESNKIHVAGLIISNYSKEYFHHEAEKSLGEWLKEHKIPALYAVDTRAVTKKLRDKGVMKGKIEITKPVRFEDPNKRNLVAEVSIDEPVEYGEGKKKIILVDCGAKESIIRKLIERGVSVKRVPWNYDFNKEDSDALFISNGPGDPKKCDTLIENVRTYMKKNKPILGICLGSQILGLAAGADTYKLKYGHRSHNQPCVEVGTQRCYITSQNHGYAVKEETLPRNYEAWLKNANDGSVEGIRHKTKPFVTVQFHPEANSGPVDTEWVFDRFVSLIGKK